jgi:hypothetical protein
MNVSSLICQSCKQTINSPVGLQWQSTARGVASILRSNSPISLGKAFVNDSRVITSCLRIIYTLCPGVTCKWLKSLAEAGYRQCHSQVTVSRLRVYSGLIFSSACFTIVTGLMYHGALGADNNTLLLLTPEQKCGKDGVIRLQDRIWRTLKTIWRLPELYSLLLLNNNVDR